MMGYQRICAWLLMAVLTAGYNAKGKENPPPSSDRSDALTGKAALTYYYDSREYSTLNLLTSAKGLPLGFELWGFTDLQGEQKMESRSAESTRYFMEYRLLRPIPPDWTLGFSGLGLIAEYNDFNGPDNNLFRFGAYCSHGFELPWGKRGSIQLRAYGYETDGSGWQGSLSYLIPFTDRLLLVGFADINFVENGSDRWVIEPELQWKLDENFSLVAEFRYNDFERSIPGWDGTGVAGGLRMGF